VSSQSGTLEREVFFLFTLASFLKVQQRVKRDKIKMTDNIKILIFVNSDLLRLKKKGI